MGKCCRKPSQALLYMHKAALTRPQEERQGGNNDTK